MRAAELQVLTGSGSLEPLAPDLVHALEEVSVTHSAAERSGFQLTFRLTPSSRLATEVLPLGSLEAATRMVSC